jgi:hypothetical protein
MGALVVISIEVLGIVSMVYLVKRWSKKSWREVLFDKNRRSKSL